jgi:hypothetical protein
VEVCRDSRPGHHRRAGNEPDRSKKKLVYFRRLRGFRYSVKCKIRFPATLIYRADCLFQPTKAFFVAGTYDFSKNMGEVLEQFHRPAAQYPTLFCPHDLDSRLIVREQNAHRDETLKNRGCQQRTALTTWQSVEPKLSMVRS